MTASVEPGHSIWLMPAAAQEAELQALVDEMADDYEGHRFRPHLTLQGDLELSLPKLDALLRRLAAQTPVQHWAVLGVGQTEHFFRSLFLRFEASDSFETMTRQCSDAAGTAVGLSPYPHVSLAYGRPASPAAAWQQRLTPRFRGCTMCFDRIALCRSSKHVPIDQWQVLAEQVLFAPPRQATALLSG